jgi:hypothetical protein
MYWCLYVHHVFPTVSLHLSSVLIHARIKNERYKIKYDIWDFNSFHLDVWKNCLGGVLIGMLALIVVDREL